MFAGEASPVPTQDAAQVGAKWPSGNVDVRMANYLCQAQQKWSIAPAADAGGYIGSPYFRITIAGTDRTLAATADGDLVVLPSFTGSDAQLWRIDQLPDGTWRIGPKSNGSFALSAIGSSSATLSKFDAKSDKQRWLLKTP
jgi:arabinan endo-1,5-alpha-L-arabinosidase